MGVRPSAASRFVGGAVALAGSSRFLALWQSTSLQNVGWMPRVGREAKQNQLVFAITATLDEPFE